MPSEGADLRKWLERRQRTRAHIRITRVGVVAGLLAGVSVMWVPDAVGLYIAPPYPLARGTFEYLNTCIVLMVTVSFVALGGRDEERYRPVFGKSVRRSRTRDIAIPLVYIAVTILWAELVFRPVLISRTTNPKYVAHVDGGTAALEAGIPVVMVTYYVLTGVVLLIYLIELRYNPVDLEMYARLGARVARRRHRLLGGRRLR